MYCNKATRALLLAVSVLLVSPVLAAKGLEYSYADVGYLKFNGDHFDMAGGTVNASFGVFDLLALRLGYTRGWTNNYPRNQDPSGDPDLNAFLAGLRPHYSITDHMDVYGDLLYSNNKFNGDRSRTDIGWIYDAGIRWQALKWVELNVAGQYRSGNIDSSFLVFNPVFKLTKSLDLSLSTSQGSDDSDYFAGLRLKF
jgi:hypothetical protein